MGGGKVIATGDLRFTRAAAVQASALFEQAGSSSAMNGAVDTTASKQRFVRRVNDGIHSQCGDIGLYRRKNR
ncbi:hypothetical protein J3E61_006698 [Mycobacterium sp. OAE908]